MHSPIAATALLEANTSQAYTPQSRGSVRREGVLRTTPFSDPNSPEATGGGIRGTGRYGISNWSSRGQYTLAPENLITLAHFSVYAAMNVPKSAGELANTA
jgi:hypothetical protein